MGQVATWVPAADIAGLASIGHNFDWQADCRKVGVSDGFVVKAVHGVKLAFDQEVTNSTNGFRLYFLSGMETVYLDAVFFKSGAVLRIRLCHQLNFDTQFCSPISISASGRTEFQVST